MHEFLSLCIQLHTDRWMESDSETESNEWDGGQGGRGGNKMCISRESNPGHIDGNDVFYHQTTDAMCCCLPATSSQAKLMLPITLQEKLWLLRQPDSYPFKSAIPCPIMPSTHLSLQYIFQPRNEAYEVVTLASRLDIRQSSYIDQVLTLFSNFIAAGCQWVMSSLHICIVPASIFAQLVIGCMAQRQRV